MTSQTTMLRAGPLSFAPLAAADEPVISLAADCLAAGFGVAARADHVGATPATSPSTFVGMMHAILGTPTAPRAASLSREGEIKAVTNAFECRGTDLDAARTRTGRVFGPSPATIVATVPDVGRPCMTGMIPARRGEAAWHDLRVSDGGRIEPPKPSHPDMARIERPVDVMEATR